jgi:hypothetical protein
MATYTKIASSTLSSIASSITFSSVSGYTDLVILFQYRGEESANLYVRFNGDTGNNYAGSMFTGQTSPAGSVTTSSNAIITITWTGASANQTWVHGTLNINNYASTSMWKTVLSRFGTPYGETTMGGGVWKNTNAVTSIELRSGGPGYSVGSTFSLYGIKAE